ncbi:MAG: arginine--tRNA ligase [Chloroflexi bacterium]|nr:arginine--tRNA ligase [Chloroflexota bacterium]|tara:strand:+ start:22808 stop:24496 length:1689 start_codon:yes stop_codon:yes gene_type:complete
MLESNLKKDIVSLLKSSFSDAQKKGALPPHVIHSIDIEITIERTKNPEHGDICSTLPLRLAKPLKMSPMAIAKTLIEEMHPPGNTIKEIVPAAPGFINFHISDEWYTDQVNEIIKAGHNFGNLSNGSGKSIQLEFGSNNPTGPLHVGHGRGVVFGSTLANILEAAGYRVHREYYINDYGSQMEMFGESILANYFTISGKPKEVPDGGYKGEYVGEIANKFREKFGDTILTLNEKESLKLSIDFGLTKMLAEIKEDLSKLNIHYDEWFSERTLFTSGQYKKTLEVLENQKHTNSKDGALWFSSTKLGEEKDNVLVRKNGSPTYFASDIAYHHDKFANRKFDQVIDVWGADHQGHISRMKAAMGALDIDPEKLTILITQIVTFKAGSESVRLSKRSGNISLLSELINDVGPDACRYFFLSHSSRSQMEFDLELAKQQSNENPVYYIQYAFARAYNIIEKAKEQNIKFADAEVSFLNTESELKLIKSMLKLPEIIEIASDSLEPHHLPYYSIELATSFHGFYDRCRVILENDNDLTMARLKLVSASMMVLSRCLELMGMRSPTSM